MKNHQLRSYLILFLLTSITVFTGTMFYHSVEGFSWIDSYYFTVGTMFTVGYGDLAPATDFGKIFTTIYMFVGVGIIGGFIRAAIQYQVSHSKLTSADDIHT